MALQSGVDPAWFATVMACSKLIAWLENSQRRPRLTVRLFLTRQSSPAYAATSYSLKSNFGGPSVKPNVPTEFCSKWLKSANV